MRVIHCRIPQRMSNLLTSLMASEPKDLRRQARVAINAFFTNRKALFAALCVLAFLLYMWPFASRQPVPIGDATALQCLSERLAEYDDRSMVHVLRPWITDEQSTAETRMIPFVGNGHIGMSLNGGDAGVLRLSASGQHYLSDISSVHPLITVSIDYPSVDAYIVEYKTATATKLTCHNTVVDGRRQGSSDCVLVTSKVYAHRKYPSVIVQDVTISNTMTTSLEVKLNRPKAECESQRALTIGNLPVQVCSSRLAGENNKIFVISSVLPQYTSPMTVKPSSSHQVRYLTTVDFSEPTNVDLFEQQRVVMEQRVVDMHKLVSALDVSTLNRQHSEVWSKIWRPSFTISHSLAPNTLNAKAINATRYAVLTNARAPLHEHDATNESREAVTKQIAMTEMCYSTHNTLLYPSKLWSPMETTKDLVHSAFLWRLTLEKRGCNNLVAAGADGIAQALLLSFAGLKFTHDHLEFATHPEELHRDFDYGHIQYNPDVSVSISVRVGEDNKAQMWVIYHTVDKKSKLYACDAACLDAPVELSTSHYTTLPVKLTRPVTPILYLTTNMQHLHELKHTVHVNEVADAPAHEHHVMALHRHGHRLGGLPTVFWFLLGVLIITFHLFLFRLIYNEYVRQAPLVTFRRTKFSR